MGGHLCRQLEAQGDDVRRVSSQSRVRSSSAVDLLRGSDSDLVNALGGVDVVYFLAGVAHRPLSAADADVLTAVNVTAPLRWLRAADAAGVRRFVWLSSIKVLGDRSARPLDVNDPYQPGDAYAHSKATAERRLRELSLNQATLAVVRPPLVYGPGAGGNFAALLRWAARPIPLPLARATAPRSMVSVVNLCDLLVLLGRREGGVFHVADEEDRSVAGLLGDVRRLLGRRPNLLAVPKAVMRRGAALAGRESWYQKLFEPLQVNTAATRETLNWSPPQSAAAALEEAVAWLQTSR